MSSRLEQETIITFNEQEKTAVICEGTRNIKAATFNIKLTTLDKR